MHHSGSDNWVPGEIPQAQRNAINEFAKTVKDAEQRQSEKLGATGEFPNGKLTDNDEGEIRFAVGSDYERKVVILDFGTPVRSMGMTPGQARELAESLKAHARRASGVIEIGKPASTDHVATGGEPEN